MSFLRWMQLPMMAISVATLGVSPVGASTEIRVAYANNPGEPVDVAVREWAREVGERSDGNLELKPFPSSQLGGESEVMEQARFGSPLITITAYSNFMSSVPDLAVIDAPYLSEDFDSKLRVFKSNWFEEKRAELVDKGFHIVIPDAVYGTRELMTKAPLSSPSDLSGVKIRVQNSPVFVAMVKAMGATPTPMAYSDVYAAMAQGVVDGLENTPSALYAGNFHEVSSHLNLTHHLHMVVAFVTGETFWRQLSKEDQDILIDTGEDMSKNLRGLVEERADHSIKQLQEAGVQVREVDIAPFRERAKKEVPKMFPQWSDGLYKQVAEIINGW